MCNQIIVVGRILVAICSERALLTFFIPLNIIFGFNVRYLAFMAVLKDVSSMGFNIANNIYKYTQKII